MAESVQLVLDLEEVQFVDEKGAKLLSRWKKVGVRWQGGSIFVQAQLNEYGLD